MAEPVWDPTRYARHGDARLQPALDLLARVPLTKAARVVDLGCGAGALFPALQARFPGAELIGVDRSASMLARVRTLDHSVRLIEADAATWRAESHVDLIVANAVLHWLADHARLLPDLLRQCRVLAVQVPDNFAAPSHRLVRETMLAGAWAAELRHVTLGDQVLPAKAYAALLRRAGATWDMWRTTYFQQLDGADAVLEWLRGTTLLPVHAALGGADQPLSRAFDAALGARLRAAYPVDTSGRVVFPFRRLFFVAETG